MNKPSTQQKKALVERFVKKDKAVWSREMKVAERLLKQEPYEFWMFVVLGYELNSLCFLQSERGKKK